MCKFWKEIAQRGGVNAFVHNSLVPVQAPVDHRVIEALLGERSNAGQWSWTGDLSTYPPALHLLIDLATDGSPHLAPMQYPARTVVLHNTPGAFQDALRIRPKSDAELLLWRTVTDDSQVTMTPNILVSRGASAEELVQRDFRERPGATPAAAIILAHRARERLNIYPFPLEWELMLN